jgi:hypothetical protein
MTGFKRGTYAFWSIRPVRGDWKVYNYIDFNDTNVLG